MRICYFIFSKKLLTKLRLEFIGSRWLSFLRKSSLQGSNCLFIRSALLYSNFMRLIKHSFSNHVLREGEKLSKKKMYKYFNSNKFTMRTNTMRENARFTLT